MKFEEIIEYLENEGCAFDEIFEGVFLVRNVVSGQFCYVENLDFYSIPKLAHYFYELGIKPPEEIIDFIHVYEVFRKGLN